MANVSAYFDRVYLSNPPLSRNLVGHKPINSSGLVTYLLDKNMTNIKLN